VVYATLAQLEGWLGTPAPADADRLLKNASMALDYHLMVYSYAVDTSGNPTNTDVLAALADCVCAQIEWWQSNGDELNEMAQYDSYGFEGAQFHRAHPLPELCQRARQRLQLLNAVQSIGVFGMRRKIGI
jgi:hypothetical protein